MAMKSCSKFNIDKSLTQVSPDLHIQMRHQQDCCRPYKSLITSPKTLQVKPSGSNWPVIPKEESSLNFKTIHASQISTQSKLKGLEEIGLFSEFGFNKNLLSLDNEDKRRQSTINISDFMLKSSQHNILKAAGGWDTYFVKKKEHQKGAYLRDKQVRDFFHPSEKKPEFYFSPQATSRHKIPSKKLKFGSSRHAPLIDRIIEKCDQAINIKLPASVTNSTSPRIGENKSGKYIEKFRYRFLNAKKCILNS